MMLIYSPVKVLSGNDLKITPVLSQSRQWHPTPVLLPRESHGRRSLVGCSPWGCEESDTTERLHFHFSLSCTGEGNGNPCQCSCLENPRDRGAWWAACWPSSKASFFIFLHFEVLYGTFELQMNIPTTLWGAAFHMLIKQCSYFLVYILGRSSRNGAQGSVWGWWKSWAS